MTTSRPVTPRKSRRERWKPEVTKCRKSPLFLLKKPPSNPQQLSLQLQKIHWLIIEGWLESVFFFWYSHWGVCNRGCHEVATGMSCPSPALGQRSSHNLVNSGNRTRDPCDGSNTNIFGPVFIFLNRYKGWVMASTATKLWVAQRSRVVLGLIPGLQSISKQKKNTLVFQSIFGFWAKFQWWRLLIDHWTWTHWDLR